MPVSGVVLTLTNDPERRAAAFSHLEQLSELTLGPMHGSQLPAVVEAPSAKRCSEIAEELMSHPGIEFVHIASVDFSQEY